MKSLSGEFHLATPLLWLQAANGPKKNLQVLQTSGNLKSWPSQISVLTVAFQRHPPLPAWVLMHPDALGTAWRTMIDSHRLHVCMTDLWNVLKPSSSNSLQARRIWTCMSALIPQIPAPIETETKEFLQQSKFHCIWLSEDLHSSMPIYTLQVVRLCARHEEMQHLSFDQYSF